MASQVRPGSTKPERHNGPQQSLEQMRRRTAHSIRARELVSHIQAECKAAFSTRDPEPKISLGMQGRPCKCLDASSYPARPFTRDAQSHGARGQVANGYHRSGGLTRTSRPKNQVSPYTLAYRRHVISIGLALVREGEKSQGTVAFSCPDSSHPPWQALREPIKITCLAVLAGRRELPILHHGVDAGSFAAPG
jgi:hypothetical protein